MSNNKDSNQKNIVLEDEKDLVLDHDYDGIQELNHPLPGWWSGIWALSFIFCIPYFMYYVLMDGPTLRETYNKDMEKMQKIIEAEAANTANFDIEVYNKYVATDSAKELGHTVFVENCAACHLEDGGGDIGPNLTDDFWINIKEFKPENFYKFVVHGNEDMGMPAWGDILSKEDIMAVTAHVMNLHGTTPAKAKDPQGDKLKE
ncbi:cytochrome C [Halobacteriovorax sp. BALOs_7]|uniref:cbb3-type cytochrome c oxidase N-terminal domain-containing protein n=1 Tax=Halobacteriovorax sp. BALOs_7 TaxID=2109558 RepID=UPI000EB7073F|nr:c-type cytochrome [Halobacteriovorax sp. BALOs_7]AYF44823.1 cytochrome C [Halobacteriovorax sp. BALOs_7]